MSLRAEIPIQTCGWCIAGRQATAREASESVRVPQAVVALIPESGRLHAPPLIWLVKRWMLGTVESRVDAEGA